MKYRVEIDGLRAVAVIPVIAFHAGFPGFSGGFLGVDIFFVISGYLISSIVLGDLEKERFSIIDFYERRARRILPALALVVAACIPLAEWLMLPGQRTDFYESVVAVALFVSNILFWTETSYFGAASELKPLLHTWSLAVEEQFYLFFPPLLWLLWRHGWKATLAAVVALFMLSLAVSQWASVAAPSLNFFLLPSRVWELMAGALCALTQHRYGSWRNGALGLLGLILIVASLFLFDDSTPFPSAIGLIPVGGVALILLFAREETAAARILSLKPFIWIGLISYSAYLWHQPLFAFMRLYALKEPTMLQMGGLSILSLLLAWFSYRFVEQPFRQRRGEGAVSMRMIFSASGVLLALMLAGGGALRGERSGDAQLLALQELIKPSYGLSTECRENALDKPVCRTAEQPKILVWGDSHAAHSVPAILGDEPDARLIQATYYSCPPLVGVVPMNRDKPAAWADECAAANADAEDYIRRHGAGLKVVIASPWRWNVEAGARVRVNGVWQDSSADLLERHLRRTIAFVRTNGAEPILVISPPRVTYDAGQCVVKARATHRPAHACDFRIEDVDPRWTLARDVIERFSGDVAIVRFGEIMCPNGTCRTSKNGKPLYRDLTHFSDYGAAEIGREADIYDLVMSAPSHADEATQTAARSDFEKDTRRE